MDAAARSPPPPPLTASATTISALRTAAFALRSHPRTGIHAQHPTDTTHVHRLLAKIPAAVADGVLTPKDASLIRQLCALMLQCALPKSALLPEPRGREWNFLVSILSSDDDEIPDDNLSPFPAHR